MTHTKHRKRRERAEAERLAELDRTLPGFADLRRALSAPLPAEHPWWGRTGRAG